MPLYQVAIPAIVLAHVIGLALLLYSLEKVSGIVSRTTRKLSWKNKKGGGGATSPSSSSAAASAEAGRVNHSVRSLQPSPTKSIHNTVKTKGWVRGCVCTEGCVCQTRWVPPGPRAGVSNGASNAVGGAANNANSSSSPFRLAVPCPADLSWHDVVCLVKDAQTMQQKQVLHPCSGIAVPGETVALMGPSGAGKSTLLDVLAGRKTAGKLGGGVKMNGRPCGTLFKRISAYVAQEDVFVPTMTAWETLVFHATLTLPKAVDADERKARIEDVLRIMGLWKARYTQVGGALPGGILVRGLSGGEKRRLSIGCGLIASPSIIFLDEPTTGLDSFAALNVMDHMRDLAAMGHTVVASIHQPRSAIWDMFHKVTVLSEGYQLYFGRPDRALAWFSDALGYDYDLLRDGAVSDWMMDLVSVGFAKPEDAARRSMTSSADVVAAYRAFQRERPPVTDAIGLGSTGTTTSSAATSAATASGLSKPSRSSFEGGSALSASGAAALTTPATTNRVVALSVRAAPPSNSGSSGMARLRSEALAEIAASSPKAVTDRLQWASGRYAASWWTQFRVLLKRGVLAQLRNPTDATSRLLLATWVGMLAGLVFFNLGPGAESVQKRLGLLFFTLLLFELLPFCYMSFYVEDRRFFAADVASDLYHPSAYYVATVIAGIPGVIVNSLAGSLTAYGLAGLRPDISAIAINSAIVCVQSLISIQLQVFCVWLTPNQDLAYVLATGYVASSILLSGFYLRTRDMQLRVMRVLSHLSYTKYAMEGVAQVELRGQTWDGCGGALGEAAKAAKAFAGMGEALGGGTGGSNAAAAAAPAAAGAGGAAAAPAPASLGALLSSAPSTSGASPAAPAAAAASSSSSSDPADQLKAYLSDHADAAQMYNQNPARAQDWLSAHGYGAAVDALRSRGENGPIDLGAWRAARSSAAGAAGAAAAATTSAAAAPAPGNNFWTEAPRRMGLAARRASRLQGDAQAGDADVASTSSRGGNVIPEIGGTLSDLQVASGGVFTGCDSTGDSVLSFWGYSLTVGQVMGVLFLFYLAFHVGSYLALSKLYKQKR